MIEIKVDITTALREPFDRSGLDFMQFIVNVLEKGLKTSAYVNELRALSRRRQDDDARPIDITMEVTCGERYCKIVGSTKDASSHGFGVVTLADLSGLSNEEMLMTLIYEGSQSSWTGKAGQK